MPRQGEGNAPSGRDAGLTFSLHVQEDGSRGVLDPDGGKVGSFLRRSMKHIHHEALDAEGVLHFTRKERMLAMYRWGKGIL